MPTRTLTLRLPRPGHGLLSHDMMTGRGMLSCRNDLDAATITLMTLTDANDPGFQRGYDLVTDATTAANFRAVLAHVDAVHTYHTEHLAWAASVPAAANMDLSDSNRFEALIDAEPDFRTQVALGLVAKLYAVELTEGMIRKALKAYERSRRVWWATALVATVLAEPFVGLPVAGVAGLEFGWMVGDIVERWRDPARWWL